VAKAEPSPAAHRKAVRKRTEPADGKPLLVHSFHTLLGDLATPTRNVVRLGRDRPIAILATSTPTQHRALDLLASRPPRRQTDTSHRELDQWLALKRGQVRRKVWLLRETVAIEFRCGETSRGRKIRSNGVGSRGMSELN
jgi:hypothetical protein